MDPLSLTLLAVNTAITAAATVGQGAMGVIGAVSQHNQAKANAQMQADQMNYNKRLEEREAAAVEAENAENARRQREEAERVKSMQRAMLGKSGAAMSSGSPLAILGSTAADEELKVQDTHYAGYRQASQHREQARMFGYQAAVARAQSPSGASLGMNIAGHGFGTLGSLASTGTNYLLAKKQLQK